MILIRVVCEVGKVASEETFRLLIEAKKDWALSLRVRYRRWVTGVVWWPRVDSDLKIESLMRMTKVFVSSWVRRRRDFWCRRRVARSVLVKQPEFHGDP